MSLGPGYEANLHRGQLLRESARFADACKFLSAAIEADPEQPQAYLELALARSGLPGQMRESLAAVDRAVALAPNSAHFLGYKAYLLSRFGRQKEAMAAAESALKLDPNSHIALLGLANAYTKTSQWFLAERIACRMLEMDADDTTALNLLAQAMRLQNRLREAREVTARILALVPNDVFGQANAGYEALVVGDHRRANRHFLEALRLDPHYEHARRGLLQSLRARNWLYRVNVRLISLYNRDQKPRGLLLVFLVFLSIATGGLIIMLWFLYILFALTLMPISNFFLLAEPAGRRALTRRERAMAIFYGVLIFAVLAWLACSRFHFLFFFAAGYIGMFALGVYVPQAMDWWRARREEKLLATEKAS